MEAVKEALYCIGLRISQQDQPHHRHRHISRVHHRQRRQRQRQRQRHLVVYLAFLVLAIIAEFCEYPILSLSSTTVASALSFYHSSGSFSPFPKRVLRSSVSSSLSSSSSSSSIDSTSPINSMKKKQKKGSVQQRHRTKRQTKKQDKQGQSSSSQSNQRLPINPLDGCLLASLSASDQTTISGLRDYNQRNDDNRNVVVLVVDINNVRGKQDFEISTLQLLQQLNDWRNSFQYTNGENDNSSPTLQVIGVLDHGSKPSSYWFEESDSFLPSSSSSSPPPLLLWAGPERTADDVIVQVTKWLVESTIPNSIATATTAIGASDATRTTASGEEKQDDHENASTKRAVVSNVFVVTSDNELRHRCLRQNNNQLLLAMTHQRMFQQQSSSSSTTATSSSGPSQEQDGQRQKRKRKGNNDARRRRPDLVKVFQSQQLLRCLEVAVAEAGAVAPSSTGTVREIDSTTTAHDEKQGNHQISSASSLLFYQLMEDDIRSYQAYLRLYPQLQAQEQQRKQAGQQLLNDLNYIVQHDNENNCSEDDGDDDDNDDESENVPSSPVWQSLLFQYIQNQSQISSSSEEEPSQEHMQAPAQGEGTNQREEPFQELTWHRVLLAEGLRRLLSTSNTSTSHGSGTQKDSESTAKVAAGRKSDDDDDIGVFPFFQEMEQWYLTKYSLSAGNDAHSIDTNEYDVDDDEEEEDNDDDHDDIDSDSDEGSSERCDDDDIMTLCEDHRIRSEPLMQKDLILYMQRCCRSPKLTSTTKPTVGSGDIANSVDMSIEDDDDDDDIMNIPLPTKELMLSSPPHQAADWVITNLLPTSATGPATTITTNVADPAGTIRKNNMKKGKSKTQQELLKRYMNEAPSQLQFSRYSDLQWFWTLIATKKEMIMYNSDDDDDDDDDEENGDDSGDDTLFETRGVKNSKSTKNNHEAARKQVKKHFTWQLRSDYQQRVQEHYHELSFSLNAPTSLSSNRNHQLSKRRQRQQQQQQGQRGGRGRRRHGQEDNLSTTNFADTYWQRQDALSQDLIALGHRVEQVWFEHLISSFVTGCENNRWKY